jgi:hypothetical protein
MTESERKFWQTIRRALMMIVQAIEERAKT